MHAAILRQDPALAAPAPPPGRGVGRRGPPFTVALVSLAAVSLVATLVRSPSSSRPVAATMARSRSSRRTSGCRSGRARRAPRVVSRRRSERPVVTTDDDAPRVERPGLQATPRRQRHLLPHSPRGQRTRPGGARPGSVSRRKLVLRYVRIPFSPGCERESTATRLTYQQS